MKAIIFNGKGKMSKVSVVSGSAADDVAAYVRRFAQIGRESGKTTPLKVPAIPFDSLRSTYLALNLAVTVAPASVCMARICLPPLTRMPRRLTESPDGNAIEI
jgi:hypothetical protein